VLDVSPFASVPPDRWVAQNGLAFALRDRHPVSPGHTLVITRRMIATWWEATAVEQSAVMDLVADVKRQLDDEFAPHGYNVGFNTGDAAGQTVAHLHVHVIPRYHGDVADPRGGVRHVIPRLANYLAPLSIRDTSPQLLVTPFDGRLYLELVRCLLNDSFDRIDLLISFVMRSGIDLMAGRLDEALGRGAHIRLLTTDYLQVTDVGALGFFLDRVGVHPSGGRLEARVFCDPSTSFHPKAYLFWSTLDRAGVGFVGSSNLSFSGLRHGVEWNVETREVETLRSEFDQLWDDQRSIGLTRAWLDAYRQRKELADEARGDQRESPIVDEKPEAPVAPWSVQREALAALVASRIEGHQAGLVVMATGLGKTWLAAFDSTRPEFRRVLFVAHREEILTQARDTYRRIRPGGSFTFFAGSDHDPSGDVVFASIQSLQRHLPALDADAFDYIVVDEFHHASAPTYRRVIGHFRPRFLLGLTATPDRADAADLLALCGDNLVYDCGLAEGVRRELLSPFRYRAIRDVADYEHLPWRSGRFDIEELAQRLETHQRAQQIFREWSDSDGTNRRALGFCCSISHAEFMTKYFAERGAAAVAVHSGASSAARSESLARLEAGELQVIFTVDLFNEGVDLPAVDLVLMLRPTESPIVFFQQMGRGLRRTGTKTHLDVLDLVGNHRSFLLKARLLAALGGRAHLTDRQAVELLRQPLTDLPPGCSIVVDLAAVDLLAELLGSPRQVDRLAELVRIWAEEHDGKRPRALELALVANRALDVKKGGGWFGFLDSLGLLSAEEREVFEFAHDFLIDIEHGGYVKSYKLVTLRAMLDMGTLRSASPLRDLALAARWQIFRDPRLVADLDDATGSFDDVSHPSEFEWERYWQKNPINALTGGNSQSVTAWFATVDEALQLSLDVPERLGGTFDALVDEIVEYRLHRYLVKRAASRSGEKRQPLGPDGGVLDATFVVDSLLGQPVSVLFESAGGAGPNGGLRNGDYVAGIDAILARLKAFGATVLDAYVDSGRTRDLPVPDRRLAPPGELSFPLDLRAIDDLVAVRRSFLNSMAKVGRDRNAKEGGGNSRKAMRLLLGDVTNISPAQLADVLAGLEPSNDRTGHQRIAAE